MMAFQHRPSVKDLTAFFNDGNRFSSSRNNRSRFASTSYTKPEIPSPAELRTEIPRRSDGKLRTFSLRRHPQTNSSHPLSAIPSESAETRNCSAKRSGKRYSLSAAEYRGRFETIHCQNPLGDFRAVPSESSEGQSRMSPQCDRFTRVSHTDSHASTPSESKQPNDEEVSQAYRQRFPRPSSFRRQGARRRSSSSTSNNCLPLACGIPMPRRGKTSENESEPALRLNRLRGSHELDASMVQRQFDRLYTERQSIAAAKARKRQTSDAEDDCSGTTARSGCSRTSAERRSSRKRVSQLIRIFSQQDHVSSFGPDSMLCRVRPLPCNNTPERAAPANTDNGKVSDQNLPGHVRFRATPSSTPEGKAAEQPWHVDGHDEEANTNSLGSQNLQSTSSSDNIWVPLDSTRAFESADEPHSDIDNSAGPSSSVVVECNNSVAKGSFENDHTDRQVANAISTIFHKTSIDVEKLTAGRDRGLETSVQTLCNDRNDLSETWGQDGSRAEGIFSDAECNPRSYGSANGHEHAGLSSYGDRDSASLDIDLHNSWSPVTPAERRFIEAGPHAVRALQKLRIVERRPFSDDGCQDLGQEVMDAAGEVGSDRAAMPLGGSGVTCALGGSTVGSSTLVCSSSGSSTIGGSTIGSSSARSDGIDGKPFTEEIDVDQLKSAITVPDPVESFQLSFAPTNAPKDGSPLQDKSSRCSKDHQQVCPQEDLSAPELCGAKTRARSLSLFGKGLPRVRSALGPLKQNEVNLKRGWIRRNASVMRTSSEDTENTENLNDSHI